MVCGVRTAFSRLLRHDRCLGALRAIARRAACVVPAGAVIFMQELSTVPVPTLFADEHTKKADGGVMQTQAWKPRGLFVQNVVLIRAGRLNNIVQGKYDCAHVVPR